MTDIVDRVDNLITEINTVASLVKRLQIQAQDLLLRLRIDDQDELPFENVTPITDSPTRFYSDVADPDNPRPDR